MGRKSFKEKEQEFLNKNKVPEKIYIPTKRKQDEALEELKNKGFDVFFKDGLLHCNCENEKVFENFKTYLLNKYGDGKNVSFSFGATIINDSLEKE